MGFFSGRVTFARFRVNGPAPGMFGEEHLERLRAHTIGKQRLATADGVEVGWSGGEHILASNHPVGAGARDGRDVRDPRGARAGAPRPPRRRDLRAGGAGAREPAGRGRRLLHPAPRLGDLPRRARQRGLVAAAMTSFFVTASSMGAASGPEFPMHVVQP